MVVVLFQQVYVMCFLGSEHPAEKLHHILTFPSKRKTGGKKILQQNQMNFLCSNYKYMYRRCGDVWT